MAVSGGVDSMALLDILTRQPGLELIVAHFDHGIRADSHEDRKLVGSIARKLGLLSIHDEGRLGADASEATARAARYAFLRRAMQEHGARAIITAHHQDDMLETAVLNVLRGTGRKGLSALGSGADVIRPLLATPKSTLVAYARARRLVWREDATNADERYLRNYIRLRIMPRLPASARKQLLAHIEEMRVLNSEIESLLSEQLQSQIAPDTLNRAWFAALPYIVSVEVLAEWLRRNNAAFDARLLHRLTVAAKTGRPGTRVDVDARHWLVVKKTIVQLTNR